MGYVLQPELKEEVRWISSMEWLADEYSLHLKIDELTGRDFVRVTTEVRRVMKNISSVPKQIRAYYHLDDWGYESFPTNVLECKISMENGVERRFDPRNIKRERSTVLAETEELTVPPDGRATVLVKGEEFKPRNPDWHIAALSFPIRSPEFFVTLPDGFAGGLGVTGHGQSVDYPFPLKKMVWKGTVLPGQRMVARWWPQ